MHVPTVYAAFDLFPSPKGAATHIRQMAATLFEFCGGGTLFVLGDNRFPSRIVEGNVSILRWSKSYPNFLDRALAFGDDLSDYVQSLPSFPAIAHFRDPWSGRAILDARQTAGTRLVYEANGFPSIELREKYSLPDRTIRKICELEQRCLDAADLIITPSRATAQYIIDRGVNPGRLSVLPNGAEIAASQQKPEGLPNRYGVYFGALQQWQGLETLLRAYALLADLPDFSLVICSASNRRVAKALQKLASKLGIEDKVRWRFGLPTVALEAIVQHAEISFAPLADCRRNSVQGCCPLKILESFASGVPVIASRLPAVEELLTDGADGFLVRPDRPSELARAVRLALEHGAKRAAMGAAGRAKVESQYTWSIIRARLARLYRDLIQPSEQTLEIAI